MALRGVEAEQGLKHQKAVLEYAEIQSFDDRQAEQGLTENT